MQSCRYGDFAHQIAPTGPGVESCVVCGDEFVQDPTFDRQAADIATAAAFREAHRRLQLAESA